MKKKKTIIYVIIGAVIVLGLVISQFVDWNVDNDNTSGDIAKSSRFSRKTADGNVGNMMELLQNDENYKNGVVTAYLVMKTRAEQFNALVDLSNEVAGSIKEFEPVLKDLQDAKPMVKNVCVALEAAAKDLDSALGGEATDELEQSTSNAALAYNTLQKQNSLATRFIDTTDKYLKSNAGNDRLKFIRDQWVDYQQMTAALTKDEALAQELGKRGYQLSEDKRAASLGAFDGNVQKIFMSGAALSNVYEVDCGLKAVMVNEVMGAVDKSVNMETQEKLAAVDKNVLGAVQESSMVVLISLSTNDGMENLKNSLGEAVVDNLANVNKIGELSQVNEVLNQMGKMELGNQVNEQIER